MQSMETVRLVDKFKNTGVFALDIAADEAGHSLDNHVSAFNFANNNNIKSTAHAGEAKGPESIKETLKRLKVKRICLLYTSPSPRDRQKSRMPSSA